MKADELMIGDWVIRRGVPEEPMRIYGMNVSVGIAYLDQDGRGVSEKFENIEPIPLTLGILEKNGFTKYDVGHNVIGWSIMDDDNLYSAIPFTLTDNDFDTEPGEYKWRPVEDDREESFVREMGRINYVHELQHLLKQCKIKKEVVV